MKETLFEMLLNFFETTLHRLKEVASPEDDHSPASPESKEAASIKQLFKQEKISKEVFHLLIIKEASQNATRVFSYEEQMKLSKSSYQFLMQLSTWGVVSREVLELIINRLMLSESYVVSLNETKWSIRSLLADKLPYDQLAYLDLVLYHKEDAIVKH